MRSIATSLIVVLAAVPAFSQTTVVLREGDPCVFFRGTSAPDPDWVDADFEPEEFLWETGPTGIGYGDDDDATILDDMQGNYLAVFLRIEFEVPEGVEGQVWTLRVRYDDGFVAYIDGDEVARRGLIGEPPDTFDAASPEHEITSPTGFDEDIALGQVSGASTVFGLPPGRHVLAAQVHNVTLDSSDLSFAVELSARPFLVTAVVPAVGDPAGGNQVTILGRGFRAEEVPTVRFGDSAATEVAVVDSDSLTAVVPAGDPGAVDVVVEDARGTVVLEDGYRYAGARSTGLRFDGDQFATVDVRDVTEEGTFEFWLNHAGGGGFFRQVLMAARDGEGDGGDVLRIDVGGSTIRVRSSGGDGFVDLAAEVNLAAGTWHHVAYAFSDEGRRLYFDGQLVVSDAVFFPLPELAVYRIGDSFDGGFITGLDGTLESARMWDFARLEDEIRRDMFTLDVDGDGPLANWPMDTGSGQVVRDAASYGFDLIFGESEQVEGTDPTWVTVIDFPTFAVTAVSPGTGGIAGGDTVRVFGTGFSADDLPRVFFGAQLAEDVEVLRTSELAVVVPPGDRFGPVDVRVETSQGTVTLEAAFEYLPDAVYALVREGRTWWFSTGFGPPPADWNAPEFDADAAGWEPGPTGIGYGDGDDATEVPEMQGQFTTLYAVTEFGLGGVGEDIDYLVFRVRYDDGYVAYLNGEEIARANVDGQPPQFDELASALHEITGGPGVFDEQVDILARRPLLKPGRNTLAIEVHNADLNSSDLSLSAELVYSAPGAAFRRGDVDASGTYNVSDSINILLALFADKTLACREAADVDNNGSVTSSDAIAVLQYLFRRGAAPAAPFEELGPDLDGDDLDCQG